MFDLFAIGAAGENDGYGERLQGARLFAGWRIAGCIDGAAGPWLTYLEGGGQRVIAAGVEERVDLFAEGPVRIVPRVRIGVEHRRRPPDDGIAGVVAVGVDVATRFRKHVQVGLYFDREIGFPTRDRNQVGIEIRWWHP